MTRLVRVLASPAERVAVLAVGRHVATYASFVLLDVSDEVYERLRRERPVEDLTPILAPPRGLEAATAADGSRSDVAISERTLRGAVRTTHPVRARRAFLREPHHYFVQFAGPTRRRWLLALADDGAQLRGPAGPLRVIVRARGAALERLRWRRFVRWIAHVPHESRLEAPLRRRGAVAPDVPARERLVVRFFSVPLRNAALRSVRGLGYAVLAAPRRARLAVLLSPASRERDATAWLTRLHGVRSIDRDDVPARCNDVATDLTGLRRLRAAGAPTLDGRGELICVCDSGLDNGDPAALPPDFAGRVIGVRSLPVDARYAAEIEGFDPDHPLDDGPADATSGHGTHVAATAVGAGETLTLDGQPLRVGEGFAPAARLYVQAVEQRVTWRPDASDPGRPPTAFLGIPSDFRTLLDDAYGRGCRVYSISWALGGQGRYGLEAAAIDEFVATHDDLCVVVAAGNAGADRDGDGQIEPQSLSSVASAKNAIVVGASESRRPQLAGATYARLNVGGDPPFGGSPWAARHVAEQPDRVAGFSGRGPTRRGRTKPDLVAPGTCVLSARSRSLPPSETGFVPFPADPRYMFLTGTSMAAPAVAGAAALVRQHLREHTGLPGPSAALVKAVLVAGARRLAEPPAPGAVFDNDQGFGCLALDAILAPTPPAAVRFFDRRKRPATGVADELRLDVRSSAIALRIVCAYADPADELLVDNLNLVARAPSGAFRVGNAAAGGPLDMDGANNVEAIHDPVPETGAWTVSVVGGDVRSTGGTYALVVFGGL